MVNMYLSYQDITYTHIHAQIFTSAQSNVVCLLISTDRTTSLSSLYFLYTSLYCTILSLLVPENEPVFILIVFSMPSTQINTAEQKYRLVVIHNWHTQMILQANSVYQSKKLLFQTSIYLSSPTTPKVFSTDELSSYPKAPT